MARTDLPQAHPAPGRRPSATGPAALSVVAVGGGVGAVLRWGVSSLQPAEAGGFGWGTVLVNLSGSFLLGLLLASLAGAASQRGGAARWHHLARLGLGTGLLGGWTTFSTLVVEVDRSLDTGRPAVAAAALLTSLVGGLALAAAGVAAGRSLVPPDRGVAP